MKNLLLALFIGYGITAHAETRLHPEVTQIKNTYYSLKDLSPFRSFAAIAGKKFQCKEFVYIDYNKAYREYSTNVSFIQEVTSYYDNEKKKNYLQYEDYRRVSEDITAQMPHFGCDGIEWGGAFLFDSPHLHMSNEVSHVGNSNLGPCYSLRFRIQDENRFVAIGVYDKRVIHALSCNKR